MKYVVYLQNVDCQHQPFIKIHINLIFNIFFDLLFLKVMSLRIYQRITHFSSPKYFSTKGGFDSRNNANLEREIKRLEDEKLEKLRKTLIEQQEIIKQQEKIIEQQQNKLGKN